MTEILAEKNARHVAAEFRRSRAMKPRATRLRPDWELRDDAQRFERTFHFRNCREALTFVQQIGQLAEAEGHHPDSGFGLGSCDRRLEHQEDQRAARERFHHGKQDRSHILGDEAENRH